MSTRTPRRRRAPAAAGNPMVDVMADVSREQFAMCLDASGALLRGFEAMRAIGQRTAQETSARHQAAARRWQHAAGAGQWMALPWSMWQDDLAGATRYWQELAAAALDAQTELLGCAYGHVFDSETVLRGAAAMEALEALPGVRTLVDSAAVLARPK